MPKKTSSTAGVDAMPKHGPLPETSHAHRMSYRIARGEQGVLTFEPYKSHLLPFWRFRTVDIAKQSSEALWSEFLRFEEAVDFVGMDMARKFIQMGMTRARRYGNRKGGRKYGKDGELLPVSEDHEGKEEKMEASRVFEAMWRRCRDYPGYQKLKEEFMKDQRAWDKDQSSKKKAKDEA